MCSTSKHSLRIVVQYAHEDLRSPWHLVAYGGSRVFRPRHFRSVEDLATLLRSTVPGFDSSQLAIEPGARESYIAWTGDIVLSESQLSALGLGGAPANRPKGVQLP